MQEASEKLSTGEYVISLNHLLDRFLVFENVFAEYADTCVKIYQGNCLATEDLTSLKLYFEQNFKQFKSFVNKTNAMVPPYTYLETHDELVEALNRYQIGTRLMIDAIHPEQNEVIFGKFNEGRQLQRNEKSCIDDALKHVSKVRF